MRSIAGVLALILMVFTPSAQAGRVGEFKWVPAAGAAITKMLSDRTVEFEGGKIQQFNADGSTLYDDQPGKWRVQGDQYCSLWPPAGRWTCYAVERGSGVSDLLRFIAPDGTATTGLFTSRR